MLELLWSLIPAELLYLMEFFFLFFRQGQTAVVRGELCLFVATLKNSDSLVYGCRKLWRSEECQLLSRHLIHPLHYGSSSLSPRNPTPGQATGTEQGNAWNPLNTFAHCFARSRPYGDVKNAAGSKVSHPGARAAGPG